MGFNFGGNEFLTREKKSQFAWLSDSDKNRCWGHPTKTFFFKMGIFFAHATLYTRHKNADPGRGRIGIHKNLWLEWQDMNGILARVFNFDLLLRLRHRETS